METRVFSSQEELVESVASAAIDLINLSNKERFTLVLTGGGVGIQVAKALGAKVEASKGLRVMLCDERFVATDNKDRNESQAIEVWPDLRNADFLPYPEPKLGLLESVGGFNAVLEKQFGPINDSSSVFDLVLLGLGEDGHIASLFPSSVHSSSWVVAEENSPKPPAQRMSLSYEALNRSDHVWFVTAGQSKIDAVRQSRLGETPASKVHGKLETIWWIDQIISDEL